MKLHSFLSLVPDGGKWSASSPGRFIPRKKPEYQFNRRPGGPQSFSGFLRKEKNPYIQAVLVQTMKSYCLKIDFDSFLILVLDGSEWSASLSSHFSSPGCRLWPRSEQLRNWRISLSFPGIEPLYLLCYHGFCIHVSAARIWKNFMRTGWACRGVLYFCVSRTSKWLSVYTRV